MTAERSATKSGSSMGLAYRQARIRSCGGCVAGLGHTVLTGTDAMPWPGTFGMCAMPYHALSCLADALAVFCGAV